MSLTACRWWLEFPLGPRVRLKTVDPPKGNGLGQKKHSHLVALTDLSIRCLRHVILFLECPLPDEGPYWDVFSRSFVIASAKVDGVKYFLLLLRPCCLARRNCRDRFALDAARARPPGVCCASPVHSMRG